MIQEDIRFFKQHFPNVTIQPSFKKATLESSPFGKESASLQIGNQFDSRLGSIGMHSTFVREPGMSSFTGLGAIGGFGAVDLKGGLDLIKNTQNDVLEQLRLEHEQIRKISVAPSNKTSRVSEVSSSVQESKSRSSTVRQDSKASARDGKEQREHREHRESTSVAIQKRFESELSMKTRRIEQLQTSEQDLQQTVQHLRTEIRKRDQAGTVPATRIKDLETEFAQKLDKEISFFKRQTERFIAENTQLKKDLVTKGFETEELRRSLRQAEDQIRFRQEQYKRNMRSLEETMSTKQSHYRKLLSEVEIQKPAASVSASRMYKDYQSFKRQELSRLESNARWGRSEYGDDEASYFRKLLNEELTKLKEKHAELDNSLKAKVTEIKDLEKSMAAARKREGDLEAQLSQREHGVRRQAEKEAESRLAEKEEQLIRKLAEREQFWARKLADAQEQWTRALSEALEREKKSNFDQFQKTFEELGRHKDSELQTLRTHRDSAQRRYTEIQSEHQQNLRRLSQQIEQYRTEIGKERRRAEQASQLLQEAKRGESEARLKNELVQREIQQLRSYAEKQQYSSKTAVHEAERIKSQQISQLQYELTEVRSKISQYQSEINELKSKNSQYENSSNENARYINELEAALKPLQPKRPNIMQQSDTQNWRVREQELLDRIEYLETQQPAEHNKSSDRSAIQFYQERIARLQSELDKTHLQSQGQLERDSRYQQEIEELKMFIIEKVEGPGQHLRQKQLEFQRELERIQIEHGQTQQSIRTQYRLEIEDLTRKLRETEEERATLETVLSELRSGSANLDDTIARLRQQLNRKDEMRREEVDSLESEIDRLGSELDSWKLKYENEVPRLKRTGEEHLRTMNEKYERQLAGLKVVNQRLMQQSAQLLQLQTQNQQLVIANRYLQSQVKEKSQAVDHLWSVKQAEYENIALQIKRVRAIQSL